MKRNKQFVMRESTKVTKKKKARKHDHSRASAEIFPRGERSTFCLSFSNCWRSVFPLR